MQTRSRFVSVLPATTEALRLKFSVMPNLWLLAKMRQLVRSSRTLPRRHSRRSGTSCSGRKTFSTTETSPVCRNVEHRMEHWMQLFTIVNSSTDLAHAPSASPAVHNTEVAQLRRELDRVRHSVRTRSPEARGKGRSLSPSCWRLQTKQLTTRFERKGLRTTPGTEAKEKARNVEKFKERQTPVQHDQAVASRSRRF